MAEHNGSAGRTVINGPKRPFHGKSCLVTGAAGFMGRYMVRLLAEQGADVVATDVVSDAPAEFAACRNVTYLRGDLTNHGNVDSLVRTKKYDYVFHVAGLFDYSASERLLHDVNVMGSNNLLRQLCVADNIPERFVFWAAGGVYDFSRGKPGKAAKEDSPIAPNLGGYLKSKYDAEMMLFQEGRELGVPVSSIRPGGVYGPGSRYGVAIAIKIAAGGGMGPFYIGPQKTRAGMVHAEDVCRAAMFVALRPQAAGEIYNVNDDSAYTTAHLMRVCARRLGFPMLPLVGLPMGAMRLFVKQLKRRAEKMGRVSLLTEDMISLQELDALLDASKLKALGWTPKYPDSLAGLLETIAEYRKEGWL